MKKLKNPYEKIEPGYKIPIEKPYSEKKQYNSGFKRQPQVMTKELSSLISLLSGCPKSKCSLFK
jgi:hypothetical protein